MPKRNNFVNFLICKNIRAGRSLVFSHSLPHLFTGSLSTSPFTHPYLLHPSHIPIYLTPYNPTTPLKYPYLTTHTPLPHPSHTPTYLTPNTPTYLTPFIPPTNLTSHTTLPTIPLLYPLTTSPSHSYLPHPSNTPNYLTPHNPTYLIPHTPIYLTLTYPYLTPHTLTTLPLIHPYLTPHLTPHTPLPHPSHIP